MVERMRWVGVDGGRVANLRNNVPLNLPNNRIQVFLGLVSFNCHKASSSS